MNKKRVLFYLFLLAITLPACARKENSPSIKPFAQVSGYGLDLSFKSEPPKRGYNELQVKITLAGSPIRLSHISATAIMPAMGTMSEMQSESEMALQSDGSYSGKILFGMSGNWFLNIDFKPEGKPLYQAKFKLTTEFSGITFLQDAPSGVRDGVVVISPAKQQLIGVKTELAERRHLKKTVRTQGQVTYDEKKRSEIALKFSGFIEKVFVDFIGKQVSVGQPLFTLYSPDLTLALKEYLQLTRSDRETIAPLARQKLLLWGITNKQIDAVVQTGIIPNAFPILSSVSGVVVEKQIVQGSHVVAGQVLYRLADDANVWIEGSVYESEIALIRTGLPVEIEAIALPNKKFNGVVSFIHPLIEQESRRGKIRVDVANSTHQLLPGMSVNITTEIPLGELLTIPKEAIIYSGESQFVFIDLGEGRLIPRKIKTGAKGDDFYQVVDGLSEGDRVVTSGNFLIAAESRLTAGLATFLEKSHD